MPDRLPRHEQIATRRVLETVLISLGKLTVSPTKMAE
jgi:hypothetical protein